MNDQIEKAKQPEIISSQEEARQEQIREVEHRFQLALRIFYLALGRTRPKDWVSIGGNPYLTAEGCKKLLMPFGISVSEPQFQTEHITNGKHGEEMVYHCKISISGKSVETFSEIGTASSGDDFFCKRTGDNNETYYLPLAEIDLTDVKKKAYANALGRALRGVFGLSNLTWDDLQKAGIDIANIKGYEFKGKTSEREDSKIETMRAEIRDMLLDGTGNDETLAREALKKLSAFADFKGYDSSQKITPKSIGIVYGKVKFFYEAVKAGKTMTDAIKLATEKKPGASDGKSE